VSNVKFTLNTPRDRKRAYRELRKLILNDIVEGRVPTFHVVTLRETGALTTTT
jgi:hypothetical protein